MLDLLLLYNLCCCLTYCFKSRPRCRIPVENALRDAKLDLKDLNEVILVGGSTRIPAVQELVSRLANKKPNVSVNPDEVVALGAAVQAGVLAGEVQLLPPPPFTSHRCCKSPACAQCRATPPTEWSYRLAAECAWPCCSGTRHLVAGVRSHRTCENR